MHTFGVTAHPPHVRAQSILNLEFHFPARTTWYYHAMRSLLPRICARVPLCVAGTIVEGVAAKAASSWGTQRVPGGVLALRTSKFSAFHLVRWPMDPPDQQDEEYNMGAYMVEAAQRCASARTSYADTAA